MTQQAERQQAERTWNEIAFDIVCDLSILDMRDVLLEMDNEQKAAITDALRECHNVIADIKQELGE